MKLVPIVTAVSLLLCGQSLGDIVPTIRTFEPKTVHISSTTGGISHIAWTLEIGKVLAQRGHNVSFITDDPNVKFGKPYWPEVKTISMGPNLSKVTLRDFFDTDTAVTKATTQAFDTHISNIYERDYYSYLDIFKTSNTNIAVCDILAIPCQDAAKALNIPLVIHMTMSHCKDAEAPFIHDSHALGPPTSRDQSFLERLYIRYVSDPIIIYRLMPVYFRMKELRKVVGLKNHDPRGRHSQAIKLINSFWGMESPRPVGPFVEYVGPIIATTYEALPEPMAKYMDEHNKVVYVAFGQTYAPSAAEYKVLLTGLLEAYESKSLDGFIWSLSKKSREQADMPKQVITKSGKVYQVQDLYDGFYEDLRFETWSPQFAILNHPHCSLFISHGGASSLHESLFNGVPLLIHPFASDQPQNAVTMKDSGVGLILDRKAQNITDTYEKIKTILDDKEGTFKSSMDTMQALVHLRSKRKELAADIIEEIMYTVRNKDDIWYRTEVVKDMSFLKARNLDLDLAALFILISFIFVARKTFNKMYIVLEFLFVPPTKKKLYKTA